VNWRVRARATRTTTILIVTTAACATTTQFDRYLAQGRWTDAANVFAADSALLNDEKALYAAAVLYGSPGRPTFDIERSRGLFRRLLSRFPQSKRRDDATQRMALLDEIARGRHEAELHERDLNAQITALTTEMQQLRARLDSIGPQVDQAKRAASRAEADLRDREQQLRTLRIELQRLKEIDLKRPPAGVIKP
jgi:hypothetical protein